MKELYVDFSQTCGKVKPMHAVNNGPVYKFADDMRVTNIEAWREAGIPYARTHDAAFYATYGGEHTVDIAAIFPDFDADENDPASYDFPVTDYYMKIIMAGNTKVFYRLGAKIEHYVKKFNTLPPKDFGKWARICEHIIRHYTEGWADGFFYAGQMDYWEIWNEPDLDPDDSPNKRCWGGTKAQFFDLFAVTAKHLKTCFPHLKIGGPALAGNEEWGKDFFAYMKEREVPIDFFSWHVYPATPEAAIEQTERIHKLMTEGGYGDAESILNEWNYVRGWSGEDWLYSLRAAKSCKGASFIAAVMATELYAPVDMLMYYDARPSGMNGMFDTDRPCEILKGYYPFRMFNELYKCDVAVQTENAEHIYLCAAKSEDRAALMFTHYAEDDETPAKDVRLRCDLSGEHTYRFYLLDEAHDLSPMFTVRAKDTLDITLPMPLFTSVLVLADTEL